MSGPAGGPDEPGQSVETITAGASLVETACEWLCSLCLLAMIAMIAAEAIARNLLGTSLQITDEVGGYLLVAVTFLSMSVAEAHGTFHRVELLQAQLGLRRRLASQIVFELVSLAAVAVLTWQLSRVCLNSWRSEDVAPTPLGTPLWLPQSVMGIGGAALCVALARTIGAKLRRLRTGAPA